MKREFNGFERETFTFLNDLRQNNNRDWFLENRERYEAQFLYPALDFVNAMEDVAAALTPPHKAVAKVNGSLRRINRDVRFSKDKTPYNTGLHLVFWTGDHPNRSAAIHFLLQPDGIGYGAGQWAFSVQQIEQYRRQISLDKPRRALVDALALAAETGCQMGPPELKRLPRGFDGDTGAAEFLRRKSLVVRTLSPVDAPDILFEPEVVQYCGELFDKLAPINAWIDKYVAN